MDTENSYDNTIRRTLTYSEQANEMAETVFQMFDKDKNGCLKKTQFIKFLSTVIMNLGGDEPTMEDIEEIMWDLDTNGDGQINKKQIMILINDTIKLMRQQPSKAYKSKKYQNQSYN